ncbi:LPO_1073/Vpar_1526 family protein [Acinetobacter pittii]|uniref:LPO_1073/Vpar_1526 family protein n=1 Tax=Acinetobacter pittii TaxID=48296 RepID=UPI00300AAA80
MSDPISLIALGAAVGGAAGKFTEKAYDSLSVWVGEYFNTHQPKAKEKAQQNGLDFLVELSQRVQILEQSGRIPREQIETAQENPSFSDALHKSLMVAAQTDNKDKHILLANTLSERLAAEPESLLALTSKMSLEVISNITPNQLNILGFAVEILFIQPSSSPNEDEYIAWIKERYKHYIDLKISNLDLVHLEALSCLKLNHFMSRDIYQILTMKNGGRGFKKEFLEQDELGKKIKELWNNNIEKLDITSVGQLLGVHVANLRTGTLTPLDYFNL